MDINARIIEMARIQAEADCNEHTLAAMMRSLVDEVLSHATEELHTLRCDCGESYVDGLKERMWHALGSRHRVRR